MPYLVTIFRVYEDVQLLKGLQEWQLELLLDRTVDVIRNRSVHYPNLESPLLECASMFLKEQAPNAQFPALANPELPAALRNELQNLGEYSRPDLQTQLDGLIHSLNHWRPRKKDTDRFDLRLALTVSKSDLLPFEVPDDSYFDGLSRQSPWKEWKDRLDSLSAICQQILGNFEAAAVEKAVVNFDKVGFFFVSSLGRPVEYTIKLQNERPTVCERVGLNKDGTREMRPRGVLWPLLWAISEAVQSL